mmetsp:Transcript_32730/g.86022  ORF Transcript_32730/g.86022 Transcript_32730/m.86022 type:complete len:271 (-) Transcript_32730:147-959(-)
MHLLPGRAATQAAPDLARGAPGAGVARPTAVVARSVPSMSDVTAPAMAPRGTHDGGAHLLPRRPGPHDHCDLARDAGLPAPPAEADESRRDAGGSNGQARYDGSSDSGEPAPPHPGDEEEQLTLQAALDLASDAPLIESQDAYLDGGAAARRRWADCRRATPHRRGEAPAPRRRRQLQDPYPTGYDIQAVVCTTRGRPVSSTHLCHVTLACATGASTRPAALPLAGEGTTANFWRRWLQPRGTRACPWCGMQLQVARGRHPDMLLCRSPQ